MIAGPTKSGKTTLLKKILINHDQMISHPIDRIVYCYSRWQNAFDDLQKSISIEFKEGFKDSMDKPYGYTILDLTQITPGSLRVQTGICPGEERIIYQEK